MTEMLTVTVEYAMTKDGVEFWPLSKRTAELALTSGEIAEGWRIVMRTVTTTDWESIAAPPGMTLHPIPSGLCGFGGCVFLPHPDHPNAHSWQG